MAPNVRLYVGQRLVESEPVRLAADQAHYVADVMRLKVGDSVRLFNGRDGEWQGRVRNHAKRETEIELQEQIRPQISGADLWLLFAPLKRARIDLVAEKASELGAAALWPVMTERTNVARVNLDRLRAHAIEAAEQCGRLTVPEIFAPVALRDALADWPQDRRILLFDETGGGRPVADVLGDGGRTAKDAILIGPEGGFAPSELDGLRELPFVTAATMGKRILRAETAAIAALTCWQAICGEWRT